MKDECLRIGSRTSRLAIAQTSIVARALQQAWPKLRIEFVTQDSLGDKQADVPIADLGGKGAFTEGLEAALLAGEIDLAVHSMKDLPGKLPAGLALGPIPERGAVHDVFVTREPLAWRESPAALRVGTSSPRRQAEIRRINPRLIASPIRGNVTTRLEKLRLGNVDALVLAAVGLERLGITPEFSELLSVEEFVPAPGQGALGLELREDDEETARLLAPLRDPIADTCVRAERALLLALGGSCLLPLGALAGMRRGRLFLHGHLLSPDGRKVCDLQAEGDARRPAAVAEELAERMLEEGGAEILSAVEEREKG